MTQNPGSLLTTDPAHDFLRHTRRPLDAIFAPKSVAVIGATEKMGSVGRTLLWNLISSPFGGTVYPINPKRANVLGIKAYPTIASVPEKVDLAVIITPASSVPGLIKECVDAGVKSSIIISAGFKELGAPGIELERQIMEYAQPGNLRIIGPNCLGVICPPTGVNASFGGVMPRTGNVAFISQSGALGCAVLDWSVRQQVGFSAFVSIGSMLDVDWGDLIDYLGNDPRTKSIVIYMESIGNPQSFLSSAREVALNKPIIVIKAGRTAAAAKAAASHTGALTGSDDVLDAAFRRVGVLRVDSIAELFDMADLLAKQPLPKGPRLTILTNAGGPGVLATDTLISTGGQLAEVSKETMEALNKFLPIHWSHNNPIDVLGDAEADRYAKALEVAAKDPNSDGLLVILTPQSMTQPTQTAEQLRPYAQIEGKPVFASWMGGPVVQAGIDILNHANIPAYPYPDMAAHAFNYMWQYGRNLKALYETPTLGNDESADDGIDRTRVSKIIKEVLKEKRTILTEFESKEVLAAYGIPTVETLVAKDLNEAIAHAEKIGFPVVLKLFSKTITHKTDVGGVQLNLRDRAAVEKAYKTIESSVKEKAGAEHFQGVTVQPMAKLEGYELILGSSLDSQFGPVLLFGSGGQLVEVYKDNALGLPPLNATLARRMMEQTRIYTALKGVRGRKAVDMAQLEKILVRFSQLIAEQPWIKESDVNPLLASPERLLALDARFVLHDPSTKEDALPKTAIRAYPTQYVTTSKLKDGSQITFRPVRPEDEPLMVTFHQTLSDRSVRFRYFQPLNLSQRTTHEQLVRVCFIDYDHEMALVADRKDPKNGSHEILGVVRLSKIRGTNESEFAIVISDQYQNQGLGTQLLQQIIKIAKAEKLKHIEANILPDNLEIQKLCEKLGFSLQPSQDKTHVHAVLDL